MSTPTRRDLFKYAVGATLASALPVSARRNRGDTAGMPLVVDLIGPMGFGFDPNDHVVDVWLPTPGKTNPHEAGIGTPVTTIVLTKRDGYQITGPTPFLGPTPIPYLTGNCQVYAAPAKPNLTSANKRFTRLTLPMPHYIEALNPILTRIYTRGSTLPPCVRHAVGFRSIYDQAGVPTLAPTVNGIGTIPFNPALPGEIELNMSITYAPFDHKDPKHAKATNMFNALSQLFPSLNLTVDFDDKCAPDEESKIFTGPLHNCKAPIIVS